jgi:hypothetical protein
MPIIGSQRIVMNKRSITGWRQVPPAATVVTQALAAVRSRPDRGTRGRRTAPKAQWETEGGTVAAPVKQVRK